MPPGALASPAKSPLSPGKAFAQPHASLLQDCRAGDRAAALRHLQHLQAALAADTPSERTRLSLILNAAEPSGWCPLLYAARHGCADVVEALLAFGPLLHLNASRLSSSGNTALHVASMHGHCGVVRQLLAAMQQQQQQQQHVSGTTSSKNSKSSGGIRADSGGSTAPNSQAASQQQQHQPAGSAAAAVGRVPGVDGGNSNGDTALMFACSSGHMGVAAALLNAGASPLAVNTVGITPLLAAAGHGQLGCMRLLQRHAQQAPAAGGAAVSDSSSGDAWQLLLAARDVHGRTALHFAAAAGHADAVALLLASPGGADVFAVSGPGRTALQEAQQAGHKDCARLIQDRMYAAAQQAEAAAAALLQQEATAAAAAPSKAVAPAPARQQPGSAAGKKAAAAKLAPPKQQQQQAPLPPSPCAKAAAAVADESQPSVVAAANGQAATAEAEDAAGPDWTPVQAKKGRAKAAASPAPAAATAAAPPKQQSSASRSKAAAAGSKSPCSAAAAAAAAPPAATAAPSQPQLSYSKALQWQQQDKCGEQQQRQQQLHPRQQVPAPAAAAAAGAAAAAPVLPAWWDEALALMAAAAPASAELDLQPQHVMGCGLAELSMCQLEALELIHRQSLARLSEARLALATQQHLQEVAEQQRRRQEIMHLAAARKAAAAAAAAPSTGY